MGCCESSPGVTDSLTEYEKIEFKRILAQVPVHCQQEIIHLKKQKFLNAYRYHLAAKSHLRREEYAVAIMGECKAIHDLKTLLRPHEDHFIFAQMYSLLSICLWKTANIQLAVKEGQTALDIILKHTSTDYTEISIQYFRLAFIYNTGRLWKEAERCFMKTIETARLSNVLQENYIQQVEVLLESTRQRINGGSPLRILPLEFTSNPGENREDLLRRATAEMGTATAAMGTLSIDAVELKRLPDKQTESQINDDILNDVLKHLEHFLKENTFLCNFGAKGGCILFIAAYFQSTQMKTSSLSPAVVEAALTIIINQMNDEHMVERYTTVKQSPFTISYSDNDDANVTGVRVFQVKGNKPSEGQ